MPREFTGSHHPGKLENDDAEMCGERKSEQIAEIRVAGYWIAGRPFSYFFGSHFAKNSLMLS